MGGHSVLQVPVPEFEPFVRARYQHYDAEYVSTDPAFVHAHITVLGPWLSSPCSGDLRDLRRIAATTDSFSVRMADVEVFDGGIIYLRPEPAAPFAALTARIVAAFPGCVPYDGLYDPFPHLTLDRCSDAVSAASTRALMGARLPAMVRADRLHLAWYEPSASRVLASFPFKSSA